MIDLDPRKDKPKNNKQKRSRQRSMSVIIIEVILVVVAIGAAIRYFTMDVDNTDKGNLFTAVDYYERAELRYDQEAYEEALNDYTLAIANGYDPISFAYFGRALAYTRLGQDDEAIEDYTTSIANDPDCAHNCQYDYNNRSLLYRDREQYDNALSDLMTALEIDPDYTRARRNRAKIYELIGNQLMALRDWDHAILNMQETVIQRGIPQEGGERTGTITEAGTQIHYTLPAVAGTTLTVRIIEADFDAVLLLRTSDGTPLAYNDDADNNSKLAVIDQFVVPADDTYHIIVTPYDVTQSGDFVLNVRVQTDQPIAREGDEGVLIANTTVKNLVRSTTLAHSGFGVPVWADNASALFKNTVSDGLQRLDLLKDAGAQTTIVALDNYYRPIALSPNEQFLALADSDDVLIYDTNNSERLAILRDGNDSIASLAFDARSGLLAIGRITGVIELWDTVLWQSVGMMDVPFTAVNQLAFLPDRAWLMSGHADGTLALWDANTFTLLAQMQAYEGAITAMAMSHDGLTVATTDEAGTIHLWDTRTLSLVYALNTDDARSVTLAFSPDDTLLASGDLRGTIRIWDVLSRSLLKTVSADTETVVSLAWRNDMSALYSTDDAYNIHIWRIGNDASDG